MGQCVCVCEDRKTYGCPHVGVCGSVCVCVRTERHMDVPMMGCVGRYVTHCVLYEAVFGSICTYDTLYVL